MTRRRRARELAIKLLYHNELLGCTPEETLQLLMAGPERPEPAEVQEYAQRLFLGVLTERADLDRRIKEVAEHWRLERMAVVDRNVLRLGAFEILHCLDVPTRVALNEAVDIAKRYGDGDSGAFVNGILDAVAGEDKSAISNQQSE